MTAPASPAVPAEPPAPPEAPPTPPATPDQGFPANTPVDQMTAEQQVAYWKTQSRKHEDRVKAYNGITAEQLTELQQKAARADQLEYDLASDKDKAVADATKAATTAADAKYRDKLAETAFRVAIGDRKTADEVSEFLADTNLSRFINDNGDVDTAKVLARVEQFAPGKGTQQEQRRGPSADTNGRRSGNANDKSVASGADLYAQLHPKKAS